MKDFLKKGKNVLILLLLFDILILALHLIFTEKGVFNLDFESNLPTVYQGSKLIMISLLAILILIFTYLKKGNIKGEWFWIFWAVMMFFIGVDEMAQIHENISTYMKEIFGIAESYEAAILDMGYSSTPWLKYYIGLFIIATVIVMASIKKLYNKNPKTVWYLIIGWLFFLGVPVIEYFNTLPHIMFREGYGTLILFEELLEIVGASILCAFTYETFLDRFLAFEK